MADAPGKGGGIEHIDDQLPALVHRVRTVAIRAHACRHHLAQLFDGGVGRPPGEWRIFSSWVAMVLPPGPERSEEHTSELQSLMRISYAVFCLKKKKTN